MPRIAHASNAEPQVLSDARKNYSDEVQKAIRPINDRYLPKFEQLKKDLTLRGDLKGALVADQCMESLKMGKTTHLPQSDKTAPETSELIKNRSAEVKNALEPVRSIYLARLEVIKQELAHAENIKAALAVEQEMEKVRSEDQKKTQGSFFVRAWNVDDLASVKINGERILEVGYREDSGWRKIDEFLKPGVNKIEFQLDDFGGDWAYGFELKKADHVIWQDKCGQCGSGKPGENEIKCSKPKDLGKNERFRAFYYKYELLVE
jgi:hypothetical protein